MTATLAAAAAAAAATACLNPTEGSTLPLLRFLPLDAVQAPFLVCAAAGLSVRSFATFVYKAFAE